MRRRGDHRTRGLLTRKLGTDFGVRGDSVLAAGRLEYKKHR